MLNQRSMRVCYIRFYFENPRIQIRNYSYTSTLATIMKKAFLLLILFFSNQTIFSQIEKDIYELDSINNLLTVEVKKIIDKNVREKKLYFLERLYIIAVQIFLLKLNL